MLNLVAHIETNWVLESCDR